MLHSQEVYQYDIQYTLPEEREFCKIMEVTTVALANIVLHVPYCASLVLLLLIFHYHNREENCSCLAVSCSVPFIWFKYGNLVYCVLYFMHYVLSPVDNKSYCVVLCCVVFYHPIGESHGQILTFHWFTAKIDSVVSPCSKPHYSTCIQN